MSWIKTTSYETATGKLRKIYDRVKGPNGHIDNILSAHSLRPHTLTGHMYLYKNVLHHQDNTLPKWYLEAIGVYVSMLNKCDYCIDHHSAGLQKLVAVEKFNALINSVINESLDFFTMQYKSGLTYVRHLTLNPAAVTKELFNELIDAGFSEGEILEINQVAAYFNYANRTVLGLGVTTEGDILGLSPSGEEDNWGHG